MLDQGVLPFRRVGTHRRVMLTDVVEHKHGEDERRREAADALAAEAQAQDLGY